MILSRFLIDWMRECDNWVATSWILSWKSAFQGDFVLRSNSKFWGRITLSISFFEVIKYFIWAIECPGEFFGIHRLKERNFCNSLFNIAGLDGFGHSQAVKKGTINRA